MTKISLIGKKVIIFDLDGTIVNLKANWTVLKNIVVKKYEEIYKESCSVKRVSHCLTKIVEKKDETVLNNFFDIIRQFEFENIQDLKPIEETIFFIKNYKLFEVKKEVKFAVLSLNTRNTIIKSLEIINIHNNIDLIIGREDVRRWKPAPDGLIRIQKYYQVNKKEMIFFGDLENDLLTGKNAGIEAHLIGELIELVNKNKIERNN
ncbi:MAG: HAD family hydrolase [Candidatus Odinarchaeota archaeon]